MCCCQEIHQVAVQSLAEMTACAVEHWHRVGQQVLLVSLPQQSFHSIANELAGFVHSLLLITACHY